jgi:hypothetical protein
VLKWLTTKALKIGQETFASGHYVQVTRVNTNAGFDVVPSEKTVTIKGTEGPTPMLASADVRYFTTEVPSTPTERALDPPATPTDRAVDAQEG